MNDEILILELIHGIPSVNDKNDIMHTLHLTGIKNVDNGFLNCYHEDLHYKVPIMNIAFVYSFNKELLKITESI